MVALVSHEQRRDALPEGKVYADDGCHIAPHCLTCPLPQCIFEDEAPLRSRVHTDRIYEVRRLRAQGLTIEAVALRLGISRRQVFRLLAEERN